MASAKSYLELSDEHSNAHKFYEVSVEGTGVIIRFGRIGAEGRREEHRFSAEEEAAAFAEKKIKEKMQKGYQKAEEGRRGKRRLVKRVLDREQFWRLIEDSKENSEGDLETQLEWLRNRLSRLTVSEIISFEEHLVELLYESYRTDLWGAAFIINGGCSDDAFDYFRGWLIAQGREVYQKALENPDNLVDFAQPDIECEEIRYLATEVYEERTGKDDLAEEITITSPYELKGDFSEWDNGSGDVDKEKAKRLYPRLYRRFIEGSDLPPSPGNSG